LKKLTKEAIEEFQALYKKLMKKDISFEEAELKADQLMRIYMLALPIKLDKVIKRSNNDKARTNNSLSR